MSAWSTVGVPLLWLLWLAVAVCAQHDCTTTSCHPLLGDLMVGRGAQLSATSTCGLYGPQNYCIIGYLEGEKKCFLCDSRYPYNHYTNPNSHQIENVITTFDPDRKMKWWQSENGVHEVSIQLNLETVFQFSHLILTFKTFRPSAMLVEKSKDNGKTWKVFRYFAENCGSSFPGVPEGAPNSIGDIVCDTRYSGMEPSTNGEVVLKALDPSFQIDDPYSPEIQELITMTNLRVNFTRLTTLGDTLLGRLKRNPKDKYYYALYEMVVRGSCFCNGHASQCMPIDGTRGDVFLEPGMVHGHCVCQHNTAGNNCERCQDLYNDAPWRPARKTDPHPCKKCNCNGHSEKCHFDMARYMSTGGVSGGVCDDCRNNRTGIHCELCGPYYYQDPRRPHNDPRACVPCNCDPNGSLDGGLCDPGTGRCFCKRHVEGNQCDRCQYGFYGLSRDNPDGCRVCRCNPLGSVATPYLCDPVTGQCLCQPFATGPMCDHCLTGYWGLGNTVHPCSLCDCDIGGAHDNRCNPEDGKCQCRPNMVGQRCKEPAPGYFLALLNIYLYEAEGAAPLQDNALPLVKPSSIPRCDQYFRHQGYDFKFSNGRFVLIKRNRRGVRRRRQEQISIPLQPGSPLQIIPRQQSPGKPITWTGPGFVRVQDRAGLRFTVNNLPASLDYYFVLRYEPESSDNWSAKVKVRPTRLLTSERCTNSPTDLTVTLPGSSKMVIVEQPMCLEEGEKYYFDIIFEKLPNLHPQPTSHILVDSMGLILRAESLGSFCPENRLENFEQYHCVEVVSRPGPQVLPEMCEELIVSTSAWIYNGAVVCRCDTVGSRSQSCSKLGGQCDCKPNVIGRCCDTCAAHAFGFGPNGCTACDCNPQGSVMEMCDQTTGQCVCRSEVSGRRCDRCQPGYFGFPQCQPCQCNGLADQCDPQSGACLGCKNSSVGPHCDRQGTTDGYYGNPALQEPCKPCLCPGTKASGRFFARSCSKDPNSLRVQCDCERGHSGPHCNICSSGFYGNLALPGARCKECQCNNNIDVQDRDACDAITGYCLRCLHHTYGQACESCEPGYYGDALAHNCKECRCDLRGTVANMCPPGSPCLCEQSSGQCPCLSGVMGTFCNECEEGFWGFGSEAGCKPCDCDTARSLSDQCDKVTGQCSCHPDFGGRRCDECGENFFGNPDLQCIFCNCNMDGTEHPSCDRYTGECLCRPGVVGPFCSECASGRGPPFPDCPICHSCWHLWASNVTKLMQEAERTSAVVNQSDSLLHTSYSCWLDQLDNLLDELSNLTGNSAAEAEKAEMFCEQISMLRNTIDPNIIIIDTSPLLNIEIDNIRDEFNRLLGDLTEKIKPSQHMDLVALEEALREIRKHHTRVKEAEQQCKDAKALLDSSRQKRKEVKEKLDSWSVMDLDILDRKAKALSVVSLNEAVAEQTRDGIASMLLSLKDSERKISEVKQKSQDTKTMAEELKKKIYESTEEFEREKNNTKDLIKQVKKYLTDEMVGPEDIEMVATAVLAIRLPSSPQEIQDVINKILAILFNSTKLLEDLDQLQEQTKTAQDLLQRAKEVESKTKSIDVGNIKKVLEDAEKIEDKVRQYLENGKDNINSTEKQLEEMNVSLSDIQSVLNASRIKDLLEQIEALKNKTDLNRRQGQEAKATADSALSNATDSKMLLVEVTNLFEALKKKQKEKGSNELVNERLNNITMEAEKIAKEFEDKMAQVEDLEKKIVVLLQVKEEKEVEVDKLLQTVDQIRKEITEKATAYANC
ncbi:laminin subunit beta-4-like [Arapaima gigas]